MSWLRTLYVWLGNLIGRELGEPPVSKRPDGDEGPFS
jgi:hypothetical protein